MRTATVSTKTLAGLDYRVWLAMVTCWGLCAGVFFYKKNAVGYTQACDAALRIAVNGAADDGLSFCKPDEAILFQVNAPEGARVVWDFNDGTAAVRDVRAIHKFSAEGDYKITATVNGRCEYVKDITVKRPAVMEAVVPAVNIFTDSARITAGGRLRFTAVANIAASSYQWTVLPTNETRSGEEATFDFFVAGEYTVRVMVNNNPAISSEKRITVVEKDAFTMPGPINDFKPEPPPGPWPSPGPPPPGPVVPKTDTVSVKPKPVDEKITETDPDTFKGLLQEVLNGEKRVGELYEFLKYAGSTQVQVNNQKPFMQLDVFCETKRKKKIKALDFVRQKDNPKYIQTIKVEVKGGIWPFN